MRENELSAMVIDTGLRIHKELGPGLLESAYRTVLAHELRKSGLAVDVEVPVPIVWDGIQLETAFRADLVIERTLLIELKSVDEIAPVHKKQVLTYLRLTKLRLGLLLNFGSELFKNGISRIANGMPSS